MDDVDKPTNNEEGIVDITYERIEESRSAHDDWRANAKIWFDMVSGEQWTSQELAEFQEKSRNPVVFNRIARIVNSICGNEIGQRQEVRFLPRSLNASGANELLTKAAEWARDQCDAEDEESDAFFDAITCGMGFTETRMDYEENEEGQVCIDRLDPVCLYWDGSAKKRNIADKQWVIHKAGMTIGDVKRKWPDKEDEINASVKIDPADVSGEPRVVDPNKYYQGDKTRNIDAKEVDVYHHQWYETKCYYKILDLDGSIKEIDEESYKVLEERAAQMELPIKSVKLHRRVYKRAFVCNRVLLEAGPLPTQKGFTINAITGMRNRTDGTWYGVVKALVDPQKFSNKMFSQIEHIIRSGAKGGLILEEGATSNPRDLEKKWAQTASVITLNEGALSSGKVMPKPETPYPVGMQNLMEYSAVSLQDVSGVNLEMLGMVGREQAGVLEAQRKQATLTILAPLFDSLRRYRKMQGRILADFVQNFLSDGRLIRIVGKDGTEQYIPLIRDPSFMEYDVIVDEAPTSPNNKERTFGVLKELMPFFQAVGMQPPPDAIRYLPLPESMIQGIMKAAEEQKKNPASNPMMMKLQADMQMLDKKLNNLLQLEQVRGQNRLQERQLDAGARIEEEKIRANSNIIQEQYRAGLEQETELVTQDAQLRADVLMEQIRAANAPKVSTRSIQ